VGRSFAVERYCNGGGDRDRGGRGPGEGGVEAMQGQEA
jgi:hypothetical protein